MVLLVVGAGCHPRDTPLPNHEGCVAGWQERALPAHDARLAGETRRGDVRCVDEDARDDAIDVACIEHVPLVGRAVDHQSGIAFGGIVVDFFLRDVIDGLPDVGRMSNQDGALTNLRLPTCTAMTAVSVGDADTALRTSTQHLIFPPGDTAERDISSVAGASVALLALLSGVSLDPALGVVMGHARACDDRVLAGVHVVVRDGSCESVTTHGAVVGYTHGGALGLASASAIATSDDGMFFALDVPPGRYVVELFETTDEGSRALGSAPVDVEPAAVSLVDVVAGRDDGVRMPAACLDCSP